MRVRRAWKKHHFHINCSNSLSLAAVWERSVDFVPLQENAKAVPKERSREGANGRALASCNTERLGQARLAPTFLFPRSLLRLRCNAAWKGGARQWANLVPWLHVLSLRLLSLPVPTPLAAITKAS